jgi:hypothetical protein
MTLEDENKFVSDLSILSGVPIDVVKAVVNAQMVMLLGDLGEKNISNTLIGRLKLENGKFRLLSLNHRLLEFKDPSKVIDKIIREFPYE